MLVMAFRRSVFAACALVIAAASATQRPVQGPPAHTFARYGQDIVLRFNVSSVDELTSLNEAVDTLLLDVWDRKPLQQQIDVRLSTETVPLLLGLLPASLQRAHEPLLREKDLVDAVVDTYPAPRQQKFNFQHASPTPDSRHKPLIAPVNEKSGDASAEHAQADKNVFFQDYQPLSAIEPWMRLKASLYSGHTSLVTIGKSYEGRDILGLRVGARQAEHERAEHPRQTILIVGGLHAREWISTSTVTYLAQALITGYGPSPRISHLLEHFDFLLIPTLNPDGYEYTWTTDRLWRKTRQETNTRFCPGVDLDRSFDFKWQARDNTCSESYPGDAPFEAVEAAALAQFAADEVARGRTHFVGFLDLHAYSETILYPYSYTCDAEPPSLENLEELAAGLRRAIRDVHGREYALMPACEENVFATAAAADRVAVGEPAGGSALDYFYHTLNVHTAYQLKLRDRGSYGFLLPREHIVPTGKEILNAVLFMGDFLRDAGFGDDDDQDGEDDDDEDLLLYGKDGKEKARIQTLMVEGEARIPMDKEAEEDTEEVDEDADEEDDEISIVTQTSAGLDTAASAAAQAHASWTTSPAARHGGSVAAAAAAVVADGDADAAKFDLRRRR